ncbi:HAD family hydrolase [Streptococcus equi subsp. zooepidemicus]|uniref:Haloacid dehalogenase-like hydrolase n=1 Tax=Streptococcus equi subsp. zooepidemicus (strain H70) TaxID=553483 RepID=C0MCT5_STRS7|nr:HAD family hydrolase [Streptococcus equi]MCD3398636.1 HAD family hydrolase [Streptococcus equi subsp. zooepidemicus]MCD3451011.1 HAD family hydrolase [Streptococcus equi subsp. zooepidemicus]MCD3452005.1 HAD family hydrolase [Streptococcus equi subsp. zooepidemicus]MCD3466371.1 HAD family hydrolase [Streptococcus equi subsp. zooepidemicus]CAW99885.1 haloacid dehalogenase-like hydrolase [Streptococcus equi subsp. zooepidemicus]
MKTSLIFDMDGVIVDSEYIFLSTKTQMLLDRGIDTNEAYQYQFMGTTFDDMWTTMKKECQLEDSVEALIAEMNHRRQAMLKRDGVKAIAGAVQLIKYLHAKGYRLAVASSSPKADIIRNLTALGLLDCFEVLVSGEEVARSKPAPDIFLKAAEWLSVDPKTCLVIEDTKHGSQAAKAAQMTCIGFANPDYPLQDLSACDSIVKQLKAVCELL